MKSYSICFDRRYRQGVKSPPFHGGVTGSNPVAATNCPLGSTVEQLTCNEQVVGSNPTGGSIDLKYHLQE